jgi:amidohydrolase
MTPIDPQALQELIALRRELHANPELSGTESRTAGRICGFLARHRPDELHKEVGGHGVLAVFSSGKPGPTVVFRCELDALPIQEANDFPYRSILDGISHKCGHDGHMATVAGLALLIRGRGLPAGKVVLLFQPAEESGAGARAVLGDPRFSALEPDFIFACHNLPKFPMNQVLLREEVFACASVGLIVRLHGSSTHSSYPEHGRSPALAVARLIEELTRLGNAEATGDNLSLVTVTQAQLGDMTHKIDFGVAPAAGCVIAVLRASRQSQLDSLKEAARTAAEAIAGKHGLALEIDWDEEFASTSNRPETVNLVRHAARRAGLPVKDVEAPFRWSEDFGLFLQRCPGAFFGLGCGEGQPQLHNEHYDYPDELIATGLNLYWALLEQVLAPPS